jgi:hypothetical protein
MMLSGLPMSTWCAKPSEERYVKRRGRNQPKLNTKQEHPLILIALYLYM